MPATPDAFLLARYATMWYAARDRLESGDVEIDPLLTRKNDDLRRGMTLLIRPAPEIRARIAALSRSQVILGNALIRAALLPPLSRPEGTAITQPRVGTRACPEFLPWVSPK